MVGDVRGKGLMIGVELVRPGTTEPDAAAAGRGAGGVPASGGLLIGKGGLYGNCLRMAPPLTLTEDEAREGLGDPDRRPRPWSRRRTVSATVQARQPLDRRQARGPATPARHGDVYDPATGEVGAPGRRSPPARTSTRRSRPRPRRGRALAATRRWPGVPQVLFAFRELVDARTRRAGRARSPPSTARCSPTPLGEVPRGLEVVEFACGIPHLLKGGFSARTSRPGSTSYSIRQPLGVVAVHLAVQLPGDGAAVVRPDRDRVRQRRGAQAEREGPVGRAAAGRVLAEAGLPDGVFNVVHGDKEAVDALLDAPRRARRSRFVGSTPIARYVYETGTAHGKRVQALGGAKNHMVVLPDADLDLAADAAVNAGLRLGGRALHGDLGGGRGRPGRRRAGRARSPSGWPGCAPATARPTTSCDMGPLVTAAHRDKVRRLPRRRRRGGRRRWWSTAARSTPDGGAGRASGSGRPCSTT